MHAPYVLDVCCKDVLYQLESTSISNTASLLSFLRRTITAFTCHVNLTSQVFYELHAERERQGKQNDVAIVRLEQLAPFPFDLVCRELYRCGGRRVCWPHQQQHQDGCSGMRGLAPVSTLLAGVVAQEFVMMV
jgi:hypothetical protein